MSWYLLAFIAPVLWAAVTLLDTYFVNGVYAEPTDGAVISGLFQSLPWLLVPLNLIQFNYPGISSAGWAIVAGSLFLLSYLAYFKALFLANDGALMQILWNLSVLIVPLLAWLLIHETLLLSHYAGILLAFVGLACFSFDSHANTGKFRKIAWIMMLAVVALGASMVASKHAHQQAVSVLPAGGDVFWGTFLLFCAGASITALLLIIVRGPLHARATWSRVVHLSRRYFLVFIFAEVISLLGTLTSQRAISLAPSVSFVAVIESLTPIFVMGASLLLATWLNFTGRIDLATVYRVQYSNPARKTIALAMIVGGIYFIS